MTRQQRALPRIYPTEAAIPAVEPYVHGIADDLLPARVKLTHRHKNRGGSFPQFAQFPLKVHSRLGDGRTDLRGTPDARQLTNNGRSKEFAEQNQSRWHQFTHGFSNHPTKSGARPGHTNPSIRPSSASRIHT